MPLLLTFFLFILGALVGGADAAENWDDLTNNLFSDLAPILALFGERVTRADCVTLAMAPLGIITIVISAIRVGGPLLLKGIVGRARENISEAEMELMLSTSAEVCEIYNGEGIVRCQGTAPVWEFMCLSPKGIGAQVAIQDVQFEFMSLNEAETLSRVQKHRPVFLTLESKRVNEDPRMIHTLFKKSQDSNDLPDIEFANSPHVTLDADKRITIIRDTSGESPNLSLNLQQSHQRTEIRAVAIVGVLLQLGVLAFFTAMVYHPSFHQLFMKNGSSTPNYAYSLTTIGTVLVVFGTLICAHVIESSTLEDHYRASGSAVEMQLVWLQRRQVVSDRHFGSFKVQPLKQPDMMTRSRRNNEQQASALAGITTLIGVGISLVGFIIQFVGLRQMHSTASLANLVAIGIMTILRAYVRRGFSTPIDREKLFPEYELDWLAYSLVRQVCKPDTHSHQTRPGNDKPTAASESSEKIKTPRVIEPAHISPGRLKVVTGRSKESPYRRFQLEKPAKSTAQHIVEARAGLGKLAQFRGPTTTDSVDLTLAIEEVMNVLFPPSSFNSPEMTFQWVLDADCDSIGIQQIHIKLLLVNGKWRIEADKLDAILSLWVYGVVTREDVDNYEHGQQNNRKYTWLRSKVQRESLFFIYPQGKEMKHQLLQDLELWAPRSWEMLWDVTTIDHSMPWGQEEKGGLGTNLPTIRIHPAQGPSVDVDARHELKVLRENVTGCCMRLTPPDRQIDNDHTHTFFVAPPQWQNPHPLAIKSSDSLGRLYAKSLLFSFLSSAAETLEDPLQYKVESRTRPASDDEALPTLLLYSKELGALAQNIQRFGFGSEQEAFLGIIASLSMANKLSFPRPWFDSLWTDASQQIRTFRAPGSPNWSLATESFSRIVTVTQRYSSGDLRVCAQGLVIGADYLQLLHTAREVLLEYPVEDSTVDRVLQEFQKLMRNSDKPEGFVPHLERVYSEQGRPLNHGMSLEPSLHSFCGNDCCPLPGYFMEKWEQKPPNTITLEQSRHMGVLRRHGLRVDSQDIFGWTSLHYDATKTDGDEHLLSFHRSGTLVDVGDWSGYTALHYTSIMGRLRETKHLLQEFHARVDVQAIDGSSPLHLAAMNGHKDVAKLLAEAPGGQRALRLQDYYGCLPAHWAAAARHAAIFDDLKHSMTSIDEADSRGLTALHLAVRAGSSTLVSLLLSLGADARKRSSEQKRTPLHEAARTGHVEIVELLVKSFQEEVTRDKAFQDRDYLGHTPFSLAAHLEHKDTAHKLFTLGAPYTTQKDTHNKLLE